MSRPLTRTAFVLLALFAVTACDRSPKPAQPTVEPASSAVTPAASMTPASAVSDSAAASHLDANALQCDAQIGAAAAKRLAERCLMVSPASRPPCNVANSCEMIKGEIDRACGLYGKGQTRPKECTA